MKKYIFALIILFIIGCNSVSEPEYSEAYEKIQGKWVMYYKYFEESSDFYQDTFTVTANFNFCEFMKHKYTGAWDNNNF